MSGLYVHVPFCIRKCLYCDFYLEPLGTGPIAERLRTHHRIDNSSFLDGLEAEISRLPPDFAPSTVYIGGGTPTELSHPDFTRLLALLHRLDLSQVEEWTVEANPGTLTEDKVEQMLEAGATRLSLGIQSFNDDMLRFLGRIHSAAEAIETVAMLRRLGVKNLNLDLIINLPGTTMESVEYDLDQLLALAPEHTSCYTLDWTPGTHITHLRSLGHVQELEDDLAIAQYELLCERLTADGLEHYELFNFARPGRRSLHNTRTWQGGEYLGVGPAASSHWNRERYTNVRDLAAWTRGQMAGTDTRIEQERLPPEARARELLMTTLRQLEGVDRRWFYGATGFEIEALAGADLAEFAAAGMVENGPERVRITQAGVYVSNRIFESFL